MLSSLASTHANGATFDWSALFAGAKRVPLPTYAFQRQRYWLEAGPGVAVDEHRDSLFAIEWTETEPESNADPAAVVELCADPNLDPPTAAQRLCEEALAWLQGAIVGEDEERLAFLTSGAVAVGEGETPDPACRRAWGLVRSAQAEHPGRFAADRHATAARPPSRRWSRR